MAHLPVTIFKLLGSFPGGSFRTYFRISDLFFSIGQLSCFGKVEVWQHVQPVRRITIIKRVFVTSPFGVVLRQKLSSPWTALSCSCLFYLIARCWRKPVQKKTWKQHPKNEPRTPPPKTLEQFLGCFIVFFAWIILQGSANFGPQKQVTYWGAEIWHPNGGSRYVFHGQSAMAHELQGGSLGSSAHGSRTCTLAGRKSPSQCFRIHWDWHIMYQKPGNGWIRWIFCWYINICKCT